MAGEDLVIVVNQYRIVESKALNRFGELPDLSFRVSSSIPILLSKRMDRTVLNREIVHTVSIFGGAAYAIPAAQAG
jgi:hypothetical protein